MIRGDLGALRCLLEQHRMDKLLMGVDSEPHNSASLVLEDSGVCVFRGTFFLVLCSDSDTKPQEPPWSLGWRSLTGILSRL